MLNTEKERRAIWSEFAPADLGTDWRAHDLLEQTSIGAARRHDKTPVISDELFISIGDDP